MSFYIYKRKKCVGLMLTRYYSPSPDLPESLRCKHLTPNQLPYTLWSVHVLQRGHEHGFLVKLAGYGATTHHQQSRSPERPGRWCQLSLGFAFCQADMWRCGFWPSQVSVTYLPYSFRHCYTTTKKAAHRCRELMALSRKSDSVKSGTGAGISQEQLSTVLSR